MRQPDRSQFAGCLIGQCLGDAAGFVVEGQPPDLCRRYVEKALKARHVPDQGRGEFGFGQYSDDSQLARELLQSYADRHTFDPSDYARRIADIFRENRIVGCGWATLQASQRLIDGWPWDKAGAPPPSAGNGSAMRAAPIGLLFHDDRAGMLQAAHEQSWITHQDRRCSAGAIAVAGAVVLAMQQDAIDVPDFSLQLSRWTRPSDPILADALKRINEWIDCPPDQAAMIISKIGLPLGHSDEWQGISPFVTTSVLWSLYSFLRSPDEYWETICTAVSVGGDVDTTAAMAGAIGGARVGLEGLPASLTRLVSDRGSWGYNDLVDLAHRCHAIKQVLTKRERSG